jgi:hypothetical protein
LGGFCSDRLRNRDRGDLDGTEKKLAVLFSQLLISMAHRMDQHLGERQYGSKDSEITPINGLEERSCQGKERGLMT